MIPVVATILGGVVASYRAPGPRLRSAIQHFAAGVVFAAVGTELLPEIQEQASSLWPLIIGFALGVALMLAIKWSLPHAEAGGSHGAGEANPRTLLITVGVDMLIDGLLIGMGFATGEELGFLLTIALTLELLFLALSVSAALSAAHWPRHRIIATTIGLTLLVLGGALIGATFLAGLGGAWLVGMLAFGAAALLYLVTEELLVEAHEVEETPFITAMFFVGFLLLFVLESL